MTTDLLGAHPALIRQGIFRGVNLVALAEHLWRLPSMHAPVTTLPTIRWRSCSKGVWVGGRANPQKQRLTLRISEGSTIERAAEVLLHELVHCACPPNEHHGELFCRRLIAVAREGFCLGLCTSDLLALPPMQGKRAYAIDEAIIDTMIADGIGAQLRADVPFAPPPAETVEEVESRRAARTAARVAANKAHARAKLAEWERRLEAAKRLKSKWQAKVRYYERKEEAAKRSPGRRSP